MLRVTARPRAGGRRPFHRRDLIGQRRRRVSGPERGPGETTVRTEVVIDSPQYVKLARILRDKITSGEHPQGARLPAVVLAKEHRVSAHVALQALAMLAANRYVDRKPANSPYHVTWKPAPAQQNGHR